MNDSNNANNANNAKNTNIAQNAQAAGQSSMLKSFCLLSSSFYALACIVLSASVPIFYGCNFLWANSLDVHKAFTPIMFSVLGLLALALSIARIKTAFSALFLPAALAFNALSGIFGFIFALYMFENLYTYFIYSQTEIILAHFAYSLSTRTIIASLFAVALLCEGLSLLAVGQNKGDKTIKTCAKMIFAAAAVFAVSFNFSFLFAFLSLAIVFLAYFTAFKKM